MNSLQWLQQWYYAHCDDTWEHQHGITIQSLDNPGWLVKVDLAGKPPGPGGGGNASLTTACASVSSDPSKTLAVPSLKNTLRAVNSSGFPVKM